MPAALDLIDERFGALQVVSRGERDKHGAYLWRCQCDCGNISFVRGSQLRSGITRSCGCGIAIAAAKPRTHGQTKTPLYRRWRAMIERTRNPNNSEFKNYGGRGIAVCQRRQAYENFAADMGPTFAEHLELDRRDTNGNYELDNCRWLGRAEQQLNKRTNHRIAWRGVDLTVSEWGAKLRLIPNTIIHRLRRGWPVDRALTTGADQSVLLDLANKADAERGLRRDG